jgi:hypothetical protein
MPSTSKKQHNFMAAVAKNPSFAKKVGVPRSVGEEFLTADKGKKFKKGGDMKRMMAKGEHAVQKQSKRGAEMVKMAGGGLAAGHKTADGIAKKGKTKAKQITMKKGGYC